MSANLDAARLRPTFNYEATTLLGPVALELPAPAEHHVEVDDSAAFAAVRLAAADHALNAIDAWLEPVAGALDWRWARPADEERVRVVMGDATLHLPWPLIRRAGPPQMPDVRWPGVNAWCLLSRFHLDEAETAMLELGGVVVLAAAGPWVLADDGIAAPLASPAAPTEGHWTVQCPLACSLPQALGWVPLDPAPAFAGPVQLRHHDLVRALGDLIPWGRGQALRLTSWT